MKKLDRLIIGNFIPPYILTFFIALFVLLMQFLWKYVDDMIGKGLEWYVVLELIFYASASMVPLALPLAVLLSSIMTYGSLGESYELFAIKSAGISVLRAMQPLMFTALVIAGGAFLFSNYYLPYANLKFGTLLFDIREKRPALNIVPGQFYNAIDGYSIRIEDKGADNRRIFDVMIYDHTDGRGNTNVILAEDGEMYMTEDKQYLIFTLYNGMRYEELPPSKKKKETQHEVMRTAFESYEKIFDLSQFKLSRTDESFFSDHERMLNLNQLVKAVDTFKLNKQERKQKLRANMSSYFYFQRHRMDTMLLPDTLRTNTAWLPGNFAESSRETLLKQAKDDARSVKQYIGFTNRDMESKDKQIVRHELEWHRKFSLSVACFILFLIGAPFGAIIRKGGLGLPLVVTVVLFIFYHIITITGEKMANEGVISAFTGMWIGNMIYLPFGLALVYQVTNESAIFSLETYTSMWEKLWNFISHKQTNSKDQALSQSKRNKKY